MEQLKFLGMGGATNVNFGGNSCFIKSNNTLLLVDICEDATRKLLENNVLSNIKEVYIVITHTHFDHVAGLGVLIWYLNFELNIKPNIIYSSKKNMNVIKKLLIVTGVDIELVNFIKDKDFYLNDLRIKLKLTKHTPELLCYGIMFKDSYGMYYYTGDTNDIDYIRKIVNNSNVKKIYSEASENTWGVHISYEDLLSIKNDKFILMHFDSKKTYERALKDGFNTAKIINKNDQEINYEL